MSEQILMKLVGLWFVLSVGTLAAATVSPSSLPAENTKLAPASSSSHGAVYREARDYNAHESTTGSGYYRQYDRPQQSRCISCLYAAMTGNQDRDRYYDQFYYNYRPGYPSSSSPSSSSSSHGYGMPSGMPSYGSQRENDDRNWYYQSDDRNRYSPYENRYNQQNRYDYRPSGGASAGYDRNENRQNYQQDYRGNGYDNRDPMYFNAMRGGNRGYGTRDSSYESYNDDRMSNRGYSGSAGYGGNNYYMRPSYQGSAGGSSSSSGYDDRYYGQGRPYERPERPEYYDRNTGYGNSGYGSSGYGGSAPAQGGYSGNRGGSSTYGQDDINFRPWDQTYRGVSGFDSLGHGHYFASYPNSQNNPVQPSLPHNNPNQQAPPRPIQHQGSHQEPSSGGHSHQTQPTYESDSHGNTNTGKGSYGGNWNYINSNDRNSVHQGQQGYNSQSQDKDTQQSSTYGERPGQRPLSTSYLHERETPNVIPGDNTFDANQSKQSTTTTTNNNNDKNNADNTDKSNSINTLKNPIDETNTVSTASTDTSN